MASFKITYTERSFGNNETVEAVLRNMNKDETITGGLLDYLMHNFNVENNYEVPRMGKLYKIPIIKRGNK